MRRHLKEHIDPFFIYGLSAFLVLVLSITRFTGYEHTVVKGARDAFQVSPDDERLPLITQNMFKQAAFENVDVTAKAYIVYDLSNGSIIAAKNATVALPLASLTKVMTAFSAVLHNDRKSLVTIKPESIDESYDLGLRKNQTWSLGELLKYTLVFSSNDGAQAVADNLGGRKEFIFQMNQDAAALGLGLHFTNPAGLDLGGEIGGKGTALDVAKMFGLAYKHIPDILDATTKKRQTVISGTGKVTGVPNTNQDIENIPGAEASKTGFTDLAGGNLGVIVDAGLGRPVVIVVLGSTRDGRFKDVQTLYKALQNSLKIN